MSLSEPQCAGAVFMVRPARFGFNPETAPTNAFQDASAPAPRPSIQAAALVEFDGVAAALRSTGIEVIVGHDTADPVKPDAIFPNNWVSFHRDGSIVLYPMHAPNRRPERREELIEQLLREGGFGVARTVDLRHREEEGKFLEGTGSLVLDRVARIAYACLSPRTDLDVLGEFAQRLDFDLLPFEAADERGTPVYHTNVLMAVGERFAVVCGAAIAPAARPDVYRRLAATGHEIVEITLSQMRAYAGNCLELDGAHGRTIVVSEGAWDSLGSAQRGALQAHGRILRVEIPTIERIGGGGVRCMLTEIHLPRRA